MPVEFFNKDQLVKIGETDFTSLDKWFILKFASGNEVTAHINEEFMWSTRCTNDEIVDSLGQEMWVTIDIALAGSGCFYSVVNSQKMDGGQSNEVLVHRSIVVGVSLAQYPLRILWNK